MSAGKKFKLNSLSRFISILAIHQGFGIQTNRNIQTNSLINATSTLGDFSSARTAHTVSTVSCIDQNPEHVSLRSKEHVSLRYKRPRKRLKSSPPKERNKFEPFPAAVPNEIHHLPGYGVQIPNYEDYEMCLSRSERKEIIGACLGEFVGTFLLIALGCGSGFNACLAGTITSLWQIASIWAATVAIACYCTGSISGAHLNPAITLATSLFEREKIPWSRCWKYMVFQMLGAIAATLFNLNLYSAPLKIFEKSHGIVRNEMSGIRSAMLFGMYFPNPAVFGQDYSIISKSGALAVETWSTAVLVFVIKAVNDEHNQLLPRKDFAPILIGLTVALLILNFSPFTMLGMNPARDLGPRIVAYFAGYGKIAIPGPRNGFWVYTVGPILGATIGTFAYEKILRPFLPSSNHHSENISQKSQS